MATNLFEGIESTSSTSTKGRWLFLFLESNQRAAVRFVDEELPRICQQSPSFNAQEFPNIPLPQRPQRDRDNDPSIYNSFETAPKNAVYMAVPVPPPKARQPAARRPPSPSPWGGRGGRGAGPPHPSANSKAPSNTELAESMKQLSQRLNESLSSKQAEVPKQVQANISKLQAQQQEQAKTISSLQESMAQFQANQSSIAQQFRAETNTRLNDMDTRMDGMDTRMTDLDSRWETRTTQILDRMEALFKQANSNRPSPRSAPDPPHPPVDNDEDTDDDDDEDMEDNPPTRPSTRSGRGRF